MGFEKFGLKRDARRVDGQLPDQLYLAHLLS